MGGASGSVEVSTGAVLPINEWTRIDLVLHNISNTTGKLELFLNGVKAAEFNGDTQSSTYTATAKVAFGFQYNSCKLSLDDVYIADGTGSAPYNDILGDVSVETLVPTGQGGYTDFIPTGTEDFNNWNRIDELPASSADYVTSLAPGNKDLYVMSDLQLANGHVLAVQPHYFASKTDTGSATLIPRFEVSGSTATQPALGLSVTPGYIEGEISTTKPGGGAWTTAAVNGLQFGQEAGA
jgi:hypothetical protein